MSKKKLGVVAVVPFWSQANNLNTDSNYAYLRIMLPEMLKYTEDTVFLMFFPDPKHGKGNWNYTDDGFSKLSDRIKFIPWPYDTQMRTSVLGFDVQRFAQIEQEYGPTIYWLHQVEMGDKIVGGYQQSFNKNARPTLIAQHHYIIHKSLPYPVEGLFPRLWAQIGGSIAADKVIFNSHHTQRMAWEAFGEHLNQKRMVDINEKSIVLPFGLLKGDEPLSPEANGNNKPVFVYNHRLESYKQPKVTNMVLANLRSRGMKFEVWATIVAKQDTSRLEIDSVKFAPSRSEYLKNIAVPAINTINSVHETFCISILDSLALGHIVVAPNAVTFPELVPEDYPYLFNNIGEQENMLFHILRTWPNEYNKWRLILSEHARKKHNLVKYASDYVNLIDKVEFEHRNSEVKKHVVVGLEKIFNTMESGKSYSPKKMRAIVHRDLNLGSQSFPPRRFIREALIRRNDMHIKWENGIKIIKD